MLVKQNECIFEFYVRSKTQFHFKITYRVSESLHEILEIKVDFLAYIVPNKNSLASKIAYCMLTPQIKKSKYH